jgi:hypothetical protein
MGKKKSKSKNKAKPAAAAVATAQAAATSPSSIDNTTAPLPLFDAESSQCKDWSSAEIEHNNNLVIRLNQLLAKKRGTQPAFSGEGSSESACTKPPEKHVNPVSNRFCLLDVSFENGVAVHTTSGCEHDFCYRAHTKERVSPREIQVINHYDLRLSIEKSERRKHALRKQRDVELERIKNLDEEEYAAEVRKSVMRMKSEHTASAKMEAEELKAGYERAAVSRELTKQLDKRLRADAASSSSSPRPNPVESPLCRDNDGSQLETSSGISESPLAAKKDPSVLVDTCHGCGAEMTHSQLEHLLNYDRSQCSKCGGVQDEVCAVIPQAAATKHRLVSEEEWCVHKLSYESEKPLSDRDFIAQASEVSLRQLKEEPENLDIDAAVIQSHGEASVPVGGYLQGTVKLIKEFSRQGESKRRERYMENLSEMTGGGRRVAAVEIPPRVLKEGREAKEGEGAKEGEKVEEPKEAEKTKEGEKATKGEEAEEGAEANRGQKLLDAKKQKMNTQWRINIDKCMAPGWPRTDSNATDHNAPFAFAKNTPEDNDGEPDPTLSAKQLDTLHRNDFVKPLKAFVVKMAAAQKLNQQINPDWEFAEPLLRVARREEELAYNAFLTARAVAEARGWRDIVEDIDDVVVPSILPGHCTGRV